MKIIYGNSIGYSYNFGIASYSELLKLDRFFIILKRKMTVWEEFQGVYCVRGLIVRADAEQYEEVRKTCNALEALFVDELKKREERGREQGVLLNLVYQVRRKKSKGMTAEGVAEILKADEQLVRKMYQMSGSHPDNSDTEIVEILEVSV